MCRLRQAGHQQAAGCPGTGTAAGKAVHQHGWSPPSAIAQANAAPQRLQRLMPFPAARFHGALLQIYNSAKQATGRGA
jgi:hypothetical protein